MTQDAMTELSQDNVSGDLSSVSDQSMHNTSVPAEKMIPQSQVNKIAETIRVGKDKKIQELESQLSSLQFSSSNSNLTSNSTRLTENDIEEIVQQKVQQNLSNFIEKAQEAENEARNKQLTDSFVKNMLTGRERYQDFDDVIKDINYQALPNMMKEIANNNIDVDTFYELAKNNPLELMKFENNLHHQPVKAKQELDKIKNSIKINENAKNVQRPNEPLRQLTPSNIGLNDGSDLTVGDFKKMKPWRK